MSARRTHLPVLMYHAIGSEMPAELDDLSVRPERLREQLTALIEDGRRLLGLTDALAADPREDVVALTFDDGYRDFVEEALPILTELGAGATQYVPTSVIGGATDWLPAPADRIEVMDADEIVAVAAAGIEIGSHGHRHVPIDVRPRAEVADDIGRSRTILTELIGRPVTSFCYPHGYNSPHVRRALRAAGYDNACAIGHRRHRRDGDVYAVERLMATESHTGEAVVRLVREGVPGPVPTLKSWAGPAWRATRWTAERTGRRWT